MPTNRPSLSIVVIAKNEGAQLRETIENLSETAPPAAEFIVVDDGSEDGSAGFLKECKGIRLYRTSGFGVARARNYGARHARGEALLFADAHVRASPGWWNAIERALKRAGVGAAAPAIRSTNNPRAIGYGLRFTGADLEVEWLRKKSDRPFDAPILPGCFLAMTRETFDATGGWDDGLLQRGGVDNEFCVRHWLLGYRLVIVPSVEVSHLFRAASPFPVGWNEYLQNRLRLAFVHFSPSRLRSVISALNRYDELGEALLGVFQSDAAERRKGFFSRRKRNDDWYFKHFALEW